MTLSKLRYHFSRALPKIVEDVEDWLQRTDFLLALLKGFVHHGRTFCADDVVRSGVLPVRWTNEMKRMKSMHRQQFPARAVWELAERWRGQLCLFVILNLK
jgi:hypothetical protein